jgi:hypothetical protein
MQRMGNLKPGASYVYEREQGTVYAHETGTDPSTRQPIGWNYDPGESPRFDARTDDRRPLHEHIMENKLWGDIRQAAKTNITLQDALERVKILYHLSKENGTK